MSLSRKQEAGFTLVEMLCTCSILGLVLALAIPHMGKLIAQTSLIQLRHQITSQLEQAQLLAMAKETETLVQFTNNQMIVKQNGQQISQITLPKGLQISSNYPQNQVIFRETGQVRGGTIFFYQQGLKVMRLVIQVASGTIKVVVHE